MRTFMASLFLIAGLLLSLITPSSGQVNNSKGKGVKMDASSILQFERSNRGFITPWVTLSNLTSTSPLANAVSVGMLIYNKSGGHLAEGFYTWDGFSWKPILMKLDDDDLTYKESNATLLKTETMVLASNNIVLTLPLITSGDDGLTITIKNIGTYTDLVTVVGNSGATINGKPSSKHTRWVRMSYVANGGSWSAEDTVDRPVNEYYVSNTSSWTTVPEVLEYLKLHMTEPSVVRVGSEFFTLSTIQTISLPFPVTFVCSIMPEASIPNAFLLTIQH